LFKIARELCDAMSAGQGRLALGSTLDRLVQYTAVHFAYEERLMQEHRYPDFAAHKAAHDALKKKAADLQKNFEQGRVAISVEVLQFLKGWLEHHIREADAAYAPYLKAKAEA
jgi:hemerythrin-like metal-binding protein